LFCGSRFEALDAVGVVVVDVLVLQVRRELLLRLLGDEPVEVGALALEPARRTR
jgi:hypothetical protein